MRMFCVGSCHFVTLEWFSCLVRTLSMGMQLFSDVRDLRDLHGSYLGCCAMRHRGALHPRVCCTSKDIWAKLQACTAAHAISYSIYVVSTSSPGHSMTL